MLLGFKKRFVEPIQIGTKVFTMRGKRKVEPKVGETLFMYSGLRTRECVKIGDKERLISKQQAKLYMQKTKYQNNIWINIDGRRLTEAEIDEFVRFDGFKDRGDFIDYWMKSSGVKNSPVMRCGGVMQLFHWTDLRY